MQLNKPLSDVNFVFVLLFCKLQLTLAIFYIFHILRNLTLQLDITVSQILGVSLQQSEFNIELANSHI